MAVPPSSTFSIPWEEIDSAIRPVLAAMAEAGFTTWSSCGGHDGSSPWVEVDPGVEDALATAGKLRAWLQATGLHGATVSLYWQVNASHIADPLLHVEWWNKADLTAWASGRGDPEALAVLPT